MEPTIEEERRHSAVMDTSSEAELVKRPCTWGPDIYRSRVHTSDIGGQETGSPLGGGSGHRDPGSHHRDHKPAHRRIVHFCEGCLKGGTSECEPDFRHNRHHIEGMDFMELAGVFQGRTILRGAIISHSVSPLEFQRILARMASRKACVVDGVPAEILKHSPEPFQENLR